MRPPSSLKHWLLQDVCMVMMGNGKKEELSASNKHEIPKINLEG
jgi:hypothetical protein